MTTSALVAIGIAVVLVVGLVTAWGVRFLERRRRLDEDATDLQRRISEPIACDPGLGRAAVLPTATIEGEGRQTVVITGHVESEQARTRVLAIPRTVAPDAAIVDRLDVVPVEGRRAG